VRRSVVLVTVALAAAVLGWLGVERGRRRRGAGRDGGRRGVDTGIRRRSRTSRNLAVARLAAGRAGDAAVTRLRGSLSPAERRRQLRLDLERRHAREVVESLGQMKGALMKLGQMASYLDDGMPEHVRMALAGLQQDAPPMDSLLAVGEIERSLGAPLRRNFRWFDEVPLAAASIGQVHAAQTVDGRDVVVKVQYPGIADAIAADLDNTELLGTLLGMAFPGLEPGPLVAELRARLSEELDYRIEADNQQLFADFYAGHPFIRIPAVHHDLCTRDVMVSERVDGARFAEVETWTDAERDMAAETIFRFVFRSLYRLRAFNGDPHPGNYLFAPQGRVTFLDFGLVKRFEPDETALFQGLITSMLADDASRFRQTLEAGRLLQPGAPFSDGEIHAWFAHYYEIVRSDGPVQLTPDYASSVIRHTFDAGANEILRWANVPPTFALIQRINLGLLALLARLGARADYRRIAEELWPWVDAGPSTVLGAAEATWVASGAGRVDRARRPGPTWD
jgi:predicted unusual protein kinase regulating ubiquinone biosynthesis (AarF/ABC1/UbiB family)